MIINHNMGAINAHRQMISNTSTTQKSTEKLSSGLRINRAGDDAAGLAISEKMRSQIRGLDQSSRNAQDGISLIQTAEGALNESHSILQRMRELAVQSANDTNTDADRAELQKEVDQLNSELTRISTDTEFNTKKLLNGDIGTTSKVLEDPNNGSVISVGEMKQGDYTVKITTVAKQATTAKGAEIDNADLSTKTLSINGVDIDLSDLNKASAQDVADRINSYKDKTGVEVKAAADKKLTATSIEYGSENKIVIGGNSGVLGAVTAGADAVAEITNGAGNTQTITGKGQEIEYENGKLLATATTVNNTFKFNVTSNSVNLQIGANAGQTMDLSIQDMGAKALGVNDIDISDANGAESAIGKIDEAIATVSSQRSNLGAIQNRLEHTINNLGTSSENLTAAESRVRDVDMAKEMMTLTKMNVLTQASQAMLAQANQKPNQVLSLLQ